MEREYPTRTEAERDAAEDKRAFGYWGKPCKNDVGWPGDDPWAAQQIAMRRNAR